MLYLVSFETEILNVSMRQYLLKTSLKLSVFHTVPVRDIWKNCPHSVLYGHRLTTYFCQHAFFKGVLKVSTDHIMVSKSIHK